MFVVLERTPFGRRLYAIGGSERVAFLTGVPTGKMKITAFAVAGLLIGVGAIFALGPQAPEIRPSDPNSSCQPMRPPS